MIAKPKFNMFSFSSLVLFGFGIAVMIAICSLVKTPFLNIRPAEIEWNAPLVEGFELAGMRAVVLKYSGTDAQFWIEKESDGVVTKFGDHDWQLDPRPKQNEVIQGVFIWIRGEHDATGMEKWIFPLISASLIIECRDLNRCYRYGTRIPLHCQGSQMGS